MASDEAEAARWFEIAAGRGSAKAQYRLAELLLQQPSFQDECRAVELLEMSAAQGYAQSNFLLGQLQSPVESRRAGGLVLLEAAAIKFYKTAADQNHVPAQEKARLEHRRWERKLTIEFNISPCTTGGGPATLSRSSTLGA